MTSFRSVIRSCGSYLPEKIVTNADLEKIVETSDEWIVQRTGIKERRMAAQDERTSDLAIAAGRAALAHGGFTGVDIDTVLVATSTPDRTFPSVAVTVQAGLGIPRGAAFDLQAVCSGFVYGLSVADAMIRAGQSKRILLIGAEKMTSILNWQDRTTCVLFGDGAGAVVIEAQDSEKAGERGIISTHVYADGTLSDILYVDGGPGSTQTCGHIVMNGKEVFRHAVSLMAEVVNETLEKNNLQSSSIDWLVPHQANTRIIEATAKKLDLDMSKVVLTVSRHGNTSAASIPLALSEAVHDGRIKQGDLLLLEALGAGLTWGAALVRF